MRVLISRPGGAAAATGEDAATATGKNLPVALPDADGTAETESGSEKTDTGTDAEKATVVVAENDPLLVGSAIVHMSGHAAAAPRRVASAQAGRGGAFPADPAVSAGLEGKTSPATKEGSQPPASAPIAITARVEPAPSITVTDAASTDPTPRATTKTPRLAEAARVETSAAPLPAVTASIAQLDQPQVHSGPATTATSASAPAPAPAPTDITAALDHLAAAREALMPAETALAIDHAEFGEVSIRFEQSREGRLSVELAAADPELQRTVTAAIAADRSLSAGADGDSGRPAGQPGQRNSAAGNDARQGDEASPRHDRDTSSRRGQARHQAAPGAAGTSAGVFA